MLNIKTLDSKITDRSFYKKICSDFDTRCLSSTNQTFEMHVKTRNNGLINQGFLDNIYRVIACVVMNVVQSRLLCNTSFLGTKVIYIRAMTNLLCKIMLKCRWHHDVNRYYTSVNIVEYCILYFDYIPHELLHCYIIMKFLRFLTLANFECDHNILNR